MSRDREYLLDMLAAARLALSYTHGMSLDAYLADTQCQDATVRRIEIIGEAARRISADGRAAYPSLPWREMIGMRNLMIHEYDEVDPTVVWATVQTQLPALIDAIEQLLGPAQG